MQARGGTSRRKSVIVIVIVDVIVTVVVPVIVAALVNGNDHVAVIDAVNESATTGENGR